MKEESTAIKRRTKKKISFKIIIILFLFFLACFIAMFSPLFRISQIEILGNINISREDILEASALTTGSNIFAFNARHAVSNITSLPYVYAASIERDLPDNIIIRIHEREAVANIRILDTSTYLLIDKVGVILEANQRPIGSLPTIIGLDVDAFSLGEALQTDNPATFDNILELSSFFALYRFFPDVVNFSNQRDITINYNNFEIAFGNMEDAQRKVRYLSGIVQAQPLDRGFIDMRDLETHPRIRFSN